jgi:transcriptional regulator with XRE-family HTH domain
MHHQRSENLLRTYRKRSGLSQREIAYLLGCQTEGQVSRYERRRCLPGIETALACQAVLGAPVSELLPGTYEAIAAEVKQRAQELAIEFQTRPGRRDKHIVTQKVQWLVDHCGVQHGEGNRIA